MITPPYLTLIGAIFLARTAQFMIVPFLFVIVSESGTKDLVLAGAVVGAAPLTSALVGLFGGYVADLFCRRTVMALACLASAATFVGFALAESAVSYLACAIALGTAQGFFEPSGTGLLAQYAPPGKRAVVFGHRYFAINVAAFAGPLIGGFIALDHPQAAFLITAALLVAVSGLIARSVRPKEDADASQPSQPRLTVRELAVTIARDRAVQVCFIAGFAMMLSFAQMGSTFSGFVGANIEDGVEVFALLMGLNGGMVIALQLPLSRLIGRLGTRWTVLIGTLFYFTGPLFPVVFGADHVGLILFVAVLTLGEIFLFPLSSALFADLSTPRTRSAYMGLFNATMLGLALGPPAGAFILGTAGFGWLCVAMAGAAVVTGAGFFAVLPACERMGGAEQAVPPTEKSVTT